MGNSQTIITNHTPQNRAGDLLAVDRELQGISPKERANNFGTKLPKLIVKRLPRSQNTAPTD